MISLHRTPLLFVILPCTHLFAKMRFPLCVVFAAATCLIQAQGIHLGSNTPADSSAVVEISSTTAGFLLPRMTTAQRNAIANPAAALQIYNTSTNCLEMYYSGGGWRSIHCDCQAYPNAIFSVPSGYINQGANFSAPPNMTYSWTFQSGSPSTSVVQSPQVSLEQCRHLCRFAYPDRQRRLFLFAYRLHNRYQLRPSNGRQRQHLGPLDHSHV